MISQHKIEPTHLLIIRVKEVLDKGLDARMRVKGKSMLPFLCGESDEVVICKTDNFKSGMIILAELPNNQYVLHRLIKVNADSLLLKGDGNISQTELISFSSVIGIVRIAYKKKTTIKYNSLKWNLYHNLWLNNEFFRKYALKIYRKINKIFNNNA